MLRIRTLLEYGLSPLVAVGVAAILLLGSASPAVGDDSKLEIHGFLTQAWGTTDFVEGPLTQAVGSPLEAETLLGLEEDGTFDYRNLAVQFRYAISERDVMVIQLSHEANGESPVDELREEIELDWGFYERRIGANSRVKVGRVPIPFGIFNEIRDVATILPFYRPSFSVYSEGAFTSETVDGITFSHTFAADSSWSLDTDIYHGEFDTFEVSPGNFAVVPVETDVLGLQFWLNTPVSGLRFGYSFQDREESGGVFRFPDQPTDSENWMASVEGAFEKWSFRGEYRIFEPFIPAGLLGPVRVDLELSAWYAQLGWRVSELFQVFLQYEQQGNDTTNPLLLDGGVEYDARDDVGIALNFSFSSQIVLKAEYHEVEQEGVVFKPIFTPQGLRLAPNVLGADGGNYTIIALATSF